MKGSLCDGTVLYLHLDKSNENVCTVWRDREELWPKRSLAWGAAEMQAAETLPKCKHKPSAMHWVPLGSASQLLALVGSTLWKEKGDKDTCGLCHLFQCPARRSRFAALRNEAWCLPHPLAVFVRGGGGEARVE